MNIQAIVESFGSKDSANRVYVSASSILAQCAKNDSLNSLKDDALNGLNAFMQELRNRPYDTRPLPSGNGHEHTFQALDSESDVLRLRIEPRTSQSGKPYTHKTLIIVPKPTSLPSFNRINLPDVLRTVPSNPITQTSPDEEVNRLSANQDSVTYQEPSF